MQPVEPEEQLESLRSKYRNTDQEKSPYNFYDDEFLRQVSFLRTFVVVVFFRVSNFKNDDLEGLIKMFIFIENQYLDDDVIQNLLMKMFQSIKRRKDIKKFKRYVLKT